MIETMKAVTIVATTEGRDTMLKALRKAGLVHLKEMARSCEGSQKVLSQSKSLMEVLNTITDESGKQKDKVKQEMLEGAAFQSLHESLASAIEARAKAGEEKLRLNAEISRVEDWGDFDPESLKALASLGYDLSFYTMDEKVLDSLRGDESVTFIRLGQINKMAAIATVNSSLPAGSGAKEFALPALPLSALMDRVAALDGTIASTNAMIADAARYSDCYRHQIKVLEQSAVFELAKATSQSSGDGISYISGYMPEEKVEAFRSLAKNNGWAYLIDDVGEEDNPPTKLKCHGLIRIIQPIYDILGTVPGYRESDISSWFLLFFSIFFAMIIGDAGYGVIFLIIAVVMQIKTKKCSDINILLYVLSATTIIYGAVTGTWFGSLTLLEKLPFLQLFIIPGVCNYSMELYGIESVYAQNNVMQFCFMLGAAQLALACVLKVIDKIKTKDLSMFGDIGWLIDIIVLYMMALYLVIGAEVNFQIVIAGVAIGFLLVVVFGSQEPGKSFADGLKGGLGGFFTSFLDTVSCFSNIMSYIRLFAVGMASLAIAQSFNNMAGMAGPVFGALIVVLGTALNLVMGLLSVVVHGVRLNLLEFSGQLGMEWTGYKYEPFRETVQTSKKIEQGDVK